MTSSVRLPVTAPRPHMHRPVMLPPAAPQGHYWVRPQAPAAAAAAPYSIPPAAALPGQSAPTGTTWEREEVWKHEERLYATALAVAGLVFQGEDEQEGAAGGLQAKGAGAAASHRTPAGEPISEKQLKCMTKRAYYKRRRKARQAAEYVLDGLLARVDAAIEARSSQGPAAVATAVAAAQASSAQQEQP